MTGRGPGAVTLLSLWILVGSTHCATDWPRRAAEDVLRTDLKTMRDCLHQYWGDKGVCPATLDELVRSGYLYKIPLDPITRRADTWVAVRGNLDGVESCRGRVADVRSGSKQLGLDGRAYDSW